MIRGMFVDTISGTTAVCPGPPVGGRGGGGDGPGGLVGEAAVADGQGHGAGCGGGVGASGVTPVSLPCRRSSRRRSGCRPRGPRTPTASKEQSGAAQVTVKLARRGGVHRAAARRHSGVTATENSAALLTAALVVAVRAGAVPAPRRTVGVAEYGADLAAAGGRRRSCAKSRCPGGSRSCVAEDFSLQKLTSHEPCSATATAGVV